MKGWRILWAVLVALLFYQQLDAYLASGYMKWALNNLPVSYEINQNGTPDCEGEFDALHQAFDMCLTRYEDSLYSTIYTNLKPTRRT